jgi:hypothetical protein
VKSCHAINGRSEAERALEHRIGQRSLGTDIEDEHDSAIAITLLGLLLLLPFLATLR